MTELRTRIHSGETLIGAFADLGSPLSVELLGRAGFDWTVIDLEHGAATEADLLALLYAAETTPMTPIVRVPSAERLRVGRALDLGAAGIMLPQLQSAAEVRDAVRYLRYPPVGQRGVALRTRGADLGAVGHADLARVINERIVGVVQVEAASTVAEADQIAALDEVDVLFVGPADLTHNLGIPGPFDETVVPGCAPDGHRRVPRARQGGGDPRLRHLRPRPTARARVPVHRARLGGVVRVERRPRDAPGSRPRLTVSPRGAWPHPRSPGTGRCRVDRRLDFA